MALCKSTMAMMILKKVVANAAEIISTLDDIQLKVCNAPRCLRSLMVNAKQVELGFPNQNLQVKYFFLSFISVVWVLFIVLVPWFYMHGALSCIMSVSVKNAGEIPWLIWAAWC